MGHMMLDQVMTEMYQPNMINMTRNHWKVDTNQLNMGYMRLSQGPQQHNQDHKVYMMLVQVDLVLYQLDMVYMLTCVYH